MVLYIRIGIFFLYLSTLLQHILDHVSGSLLDIIKHKMKTEDCKHGVFDEATVATVLREVLKGLEYFHNNGQIHRYKNCFTTNILKTLVNCCQNHLIVFSSR